MMREPPCAVYDFRSLSRSRFVFEETPLMMSYIPGFVAAIIAFVVLKLISWIDSTALQAFIFLAAYGVAAVGIEKGMKRYGADKL